MLTLGELGYDKVMVCVNFVDWSFFAPFRSILFQPIILVPHFFKDQS